MHLFASARWRRSSFLISFNRLVRAVTKVQTANSQLLFRREMPKVDASRVRLRLFDVFVHPARMILEEFFNQSKIIQR